MFDMTPMYPGCCSCREEPGCLKLPLFGRPAPPPRPPACSTERCGTPCRTQSVTLQNPMNPCECATVDLSVDECGNLVVCVRRDVPPMRPQPRRRKYC